MGALVEAWSQDRSDRLTPTSTKNERLFGNSIPFGRDLADQLEPAKVKAWMRQYATGRDGSGRVRHRSTANRWLAMLKNAYRWGLERSLVEDLTCYRIDRIQPLKYREGGKESVPRVPPSEENLQAVRAELLPHHRDFLDLLVLTGCRSGELRAFSWSEVDTNVLPWEYKPLRHKSSHLGKPRIIFFGPAARQILERYHSEECPFARDRSTFSKALTKAAEAAGCKAFSAHQVRHYAATRWRQQFGQEQARYLLGHTSISMTERYTWTARSQIASLVEQVC